MDWRKVPDREAALSPDRVAKVYKYRTLSRGRLWKIGGLAKKPYLRPPRPSLFNTPTRKKTRIYMSCERYNHVPTYSDWCNTKFLFACLQMWCNAFENEMHSSRLEKFPSESRQPAGLEADEDEIMSQFSNFSHHPPLVELSARQRYRSRQV